MPRYYKEKIFTEEQNRIFGAEALKLVRPLSLTPTKRFEINQMNKKQNKIHHEKRTKI